MPENIILSQAEMQALTLLKNSPDEVQKIVRTDGTINIDDIHKYFDTLQRQLEFSYIKRRQDYIDIEQIKETE